MSVSLSHCLVSLYNILINLIVSRYVSHLTYNCCSTRLMFVSIIYRFFLFRTPKSVEFNYYFYKNNSFSLYFCHKREREREMIRFFLIVNRSCKTRCAKYYQTIQDTSAFELEIARKCITRKQNQARIIIIRRTFLTKEQTLFFQLDEYKIGNFTTGQKKKSY